ncbi:MAG: hypothetical protein CM15mP74_22370 [Halieaceae bacterium]|nr:MAG: hypothetical protein CM15mP74_22370 [Halieaceae bacterium]
MSVAIWRQGRRNSLPLRQRCKNSLDAMRVFGGYSYSPEYEIERFYRDAPLLCIGEGTNEIQRMIIAKQMVARAS